MRYQTDAIVLRQGPYSESSQIVHLLTASEGRVAALARGSYRPRSGFGGPIDVLTGGRADIGARSVGDLDVVYTFAVDRPFRGLRTTPWGYTASCYLLEITLALSYHRDRQTGLYELLLAALAALDAAAGGAAVEPWLLAYPLHALARAGLAPRLDACATCDRAAESGVLAAAAGGFVCDRCPVPDRAAPLGEGAVRLLRRVVDGQPAREPASGAALEQARRAIDQWLEYRLERPIRSRHQLSWGLHSEASRS